MNHIDAYLFKNSLRLIQMLIDSPTMSDEDKARIKAEIQSMLSVLNKYDKK